MTFFAIMASLWWHTLCDAVPQGDISLALLSFVCYAGSVVGGYIIEMKLYKRIKNLEKELRKDV